MAGRVAVIGAGSSGITAVKNFVEAGFSDIVCFERRDVIGGLWYFHEEGSRWSDEVMIYRSTIINSNKEHMAFSDYPMPGFYPNFCHNSFMKEYFEDYCRHFDVYKYIRFNAEVLSFKEHSTYSSTGRWEIRTKDHKTGQKSTEVFDYVIVANGHHGRPHLPSFPGLENFKGTKMHSRDFKDIQSVSGSKAVVVGIGNSGGDISVELSKYMKVFLSTRRGAWIMNRLDKHGLPFDLMYHSRLTTFISGLLPRWYKLSRQKARLNQWFDHDMYHMTPLHEPDAYTPTITDDLPNRIAAGMVKIKPDIQTFTENGVIFEDGTTADNIDVVIFATGYDTKCSLIDEKIVHIQQNELDLYKYMWLPDLPKQTLAFLAVCQPLGAMFPIAELQSRLAARVFKGEVTLPAAALMKKDICAKERELRRRFIASWRQKKIVDWLPYLDELATLVGCKPNMLKLFFTDPALFWKVLTGPGVPYQYRLHGPNTWSGARQAIFTVMDRVRKPFETRPLPCKQKKSSLKACLFAVSIATVIVLYVIREVTVEVNAID